VTTILLARHGETAWNAERRWQGHADEPLNEVGRAQARRLGEELANVDLAAAYSSDLRRARETAEIAVSGRAIPVVMMEALREVHVGDWSGLTHAEIEQRFPAAVRRWREGGRGWNGGETYDEMGARVVEALRRIAEAHEAETVLVVGHGGGIRAARAHAAGLTYAESRATGWRSAGNCEVVSVRVEDDALVVVDDGELDRRRAASG
jgi:broad specificity phosphatase PhoE